MELGVVFGGGVLEEGGSKVFDKVRWQDAHAEGGLHSRF
jgi:hypothetical protein